MKLQIEIIIHHQWERHVVFGIGFHRQSNAVSHSGNHRKSNSIGRKNHAFIQTKPGQWLLGICFWRVASEIAIGSDRRAGKWGLARYRTMQVGNPEEIVARPHYFGALMVQYGQADAIVGGNQAMPSAYFRALLHTIKPLPNVPKIFGVSVLIGPHLKNLGASGILMLADSALIPNPDVSELASIAVETGKLAHHFLGRKPLVAMLSHSTKGSAGNPDARRMAAAASLAQAEVLKNFLDIDIEGELQADVALDPEAAEIKLPGAQARPTADVLVFPNLDAAHIALKLMQHVAGTQTYGQFILGLSRPAAQIPRTSTAETIFGTAVAIAVEAIKFHQLYPDGEV